MQVVLNNQQFKETITRLAREIESRHGQLKDILFIGIQRGGVVVAEELVRILSSNYPGISEAYGQLDITFYRDDIRKNILTPDSMYLPFSIEDKIIVLVDDVLFTGRTIKAALDVLLDYGRPARVELLVLADRKEHRQFPIQADYVGITLPTDRSQKLKLVSTNEGNQNLALLDS